VLRGEPLFGLRVTAGTLACSSERPHGVVGKVILRDSQNDRQKPARLMPRAMVSRRWWRVNLRVIYLVSALVASEDRMKENIRTAALLFPKSATASSSAIGVAYLGGA
jgi:hypothetical protein